MSSDPWAEFRPVTPAAQPADPWAGFLPGPSVQGQVAPDQGARLEGLWRDVQEGRTRFSQLPRAEQDAIVSRFAPSNAGNAAAQGMMMNWADEATAGVNAALETIGLGRRYAGQSIGERYEDHKAFQDAQMRTYAAANPKTDLAAKVGGGLFGMVLPAATLVRGTGLGAATANAAITGGLYGAAAGAGEGNSAEERLWNAAKGAGIGGGIGLAAPFVARGVGNAAGAVADMYRGTPAAIRPFERGAIDRVSRAVRDDAADPAALQRLGPEGMIADLGSNLRMQAGGIAATPGQGQTTIMNALRTRAEGAPQRIADDVTQALGPARSVPETLDSIRSTYGARAGALYDEFRSTPVPFTREVEGTLEALRTTRAGQAAIRDAMENAAIDAAAGRGARQPQFFANIADDGSIAFQRVPNAQEWDYIKRALDGHTSAARRSGNGNVESQFSALSQRVRNVVDEAISPGAPAESVWARARGVAGEGFGLREALQEGTQAFSKRISPDQMRASMAGLSEAERAAYMMGARDNVRQVMGNAATKWGDNPDTVARALLGSQNAREKLGLIAPRGADTLTRRLDAETAFDRTVQTATGNSITAARANAAAEFPGPTGGPFNQTSVGHSSAFGTVMRGVTKVANALAGGAINERNSRIARDAASMLTATGTPRDQILAALMQQSESRAVTEEGRKGIERIARALLQTPRPAAVDWLLR